MKLGRPPQSYDPRAMADQAAQIERADQMNYKRDRDLEIGQNRVILTSPNGSRYAIVVDNAGVLSTVPV